MGMSFESVVFHRPAGEAWQTLQPKLEELLQAYGLGPVYESSDGTSGVVYDTEMSAEEDMPELVCAVSALTGGTAIGAVCLDSDFVGVVLARNGEQMDMGYIGVPYGAEEEEGLELHTEQWLPLLTRPEDAAALEDCLHGGFVFGGGSAAHVEPAHWLAGVGRRYFNAVPGRIRGFLAG